jgi:hypothetical protein
MSLPSALLDDGEGGAPRPPPPGLPPPRAQRYVWETGTLRFLNSQTPTGSGFGFIKRPPGALPIAMDGASASSHQFQAAGESTSQHSEPGERGPALRGPSGEVKSLYFSVDDLVDPACAHTLSRGMRLRYAVLPPGKATTSYAIDVLLPGGGRRVMSAHPHPSRPKAVAVHAVTDEPEPPPPGRPAIVPRSAAVGGRGHGVQPPTLKTATTLKPLPGEPPLPTAPPPPSFAPSWHTGASLGSIGAGFGPPAALWTPPPPLAVRIAQPHEADPLDTYAAQHSSLTATANGLLSDLTATLRHLAEVDSLLVRSPPRRLEERIPAMGGIGGGGTGLQQLPLPPGLHRAPPQTYGQQLSGVSGVPAWPSSVNLVNLEPLHTSLASWTSQEGGWGGQEGGSATRRVPPPPPPTPPQQRPGQGYPGWSM